MGRTRVRRKGQRRPFNKSKRLALRRSRLRSRSRKKRTSLRRRRSAKKRSLVGG